MRLMSINAQLCKFFTFYGPLASVLILSAFYTVVKCVKNEANRDLSHIFTLIERKRFFITFLRCFKY